MWRMSSVNATALIACDGENGGFFYNESQRLTI